jgi:mannan endo-1,4-beta-mannosidase
MRLIAISATLLALAASFASAQTTRIEAEDARLEGPDLHAVRPAPGDGHAFVGYSGTGFVTGFDNPSDRVVFSYNAAGPGAYDVKIGYRSGHRGYELQVNDLTLSGMFSAETPENFSIQEEGLVELNAGANTLTIGRGWLHYDIDFIEISPSAPITLPAKITTPPVDPQATPEARALLQRLDDTYGHGSFMGVYSDEDAKYVLDNTGHLPAIMGGDLSSYSPASVAHRRPDDTRSNHETERMIAHAKEGYMVSMCWHWVSPFGLLNRKMPAQNAKPAYDAMWYRGFYTEATSFDVSIAMNDPLSVERQYLIRDIDAIAVQLRKFQDANVPILWRPLHEGQGAWFWWGAKGPEPFVALWRLMYDRLVNVDGIHNLIWVYTSADDPAWYPGDAYVDVVGIDAYPADIRDPQSELWARLSKEFAGRKPLALSEFGGVPDVERMHRLGNDWVYAVSWSGVYGPKKNSLDELKRIYAGDFALKQAAHPGTTGAPAGNSR